MIEIFRIASSLNYVAVTAQLIIPRSTTCACAKSFDKYSVPKHFIIKRPPAHLVINFHTHYYQIHNKSPTIAFVGTLRRLFFGPSISPAAMADAKSKAQGIINDNGVVVFSKSYCPYCKATKTLLGQKNAKFFLMELDQVCKFTLLRSSVYIIEY